MSPWCSSCARPSRMVVRLASSCWESSRSEGSASPGWYSPARMASRICPAIPSASSDRLTAAKVMRPWLDWSTGPTSLLPRSPAGQACLARSRATRETPVMTADGGKPVPRPASLVGAVLDEESRRQTESVSAEPERTVDIASLPGVGGDDVPLRSGLHRDGRTLLLTVGAMWALGLAVFAMTAILAIKIAHDYDWSFRF